MRNYTDTEFFDAPFRGVTSVLNAIFGNKFENSGIPEHVLRMAGERGTAVHKYIEEWLNWYEGTTGYEPHIGLEYAVYETVWKEPYLYSSNSTVMVHIRRLRVKIEPNPQQPIYIKTVWGKGYKFGGNEKA